MSQLTLLIIALVFVILPAVVTFIRKRIRQSTRGLSRDDGVPSDAEGMSKNLLYPFADKGRIAGAFPGARESIPFPNARKKTENTAKWRADTMESVDPMMSSAVARKQETRTIILQKIEDRLNTWSPCTKLGDIFMEMVCDFILEIQREFYTQETKSKNSPAI